MVRMFERFGLQTNLGKTKSMVCTMGFVWVQQVADAYKRQDTVGGPTFRESKRTRVSCEVSEVQWPPLICNIIWRGCMVEYCYR